MQFAICRPAPNSASRAPTAIEQHGLRCLKFGSEYFCCAADATTAVDWKKLETSGGSLNFAKKGAARSDAGSLYVVTQEGRLFQRAYPDAPVLFDKGRHLVVALDHQTAGKIVPHEARFSIRPATESEIIVDTLARPTAPLRIDDRIKRLVQAVSQTSFAATLRMLASFPTRHSLTDHFQDAAKQVRDRLSEMGYQVSLQNVNIPGGNMLNVIADKRGLGSEGRSLALVTAHLDSVNHPADHSQPDDPTSSAPGADDNGSGSAGVIEIARVLKDQPVTQDLRLILFGGEEQGLFGSKHYVRQLPANERTRVKAVVNMDMIAVVNTKSPTVLLEGGDPVSKNMIDEMASAAHTYTNLTVNTSLHPFNSDHVPFIRADMPAVLTIEGNDDANHNIHGANDTLDHINFDLALEILRMNTAFIAGKIAV